MTRALPSSSRVLGLCGLVSALLLTFGAGRPSALSAAGVVMVGANLYALIRG